MLGVVVFAHGSRDPLWRQPVEAVAASIAASDPQAIVRCAYLELTAPDLATAVRELVQAGATRVRVLPLFFGMASMPGRTFPYWWTVCGTSTRTFVSRSCLLPAKTAD